MLFDQFFPQYRRDGHLMLKTIIVIAIAYVSSSNSRTVFVRENSPAGTIVANLYDHVKEGDVAKRANTFILLNQKLVGHIRNHSNRKRNWFALNKKTGMLMVKNVFDREAMCHKSIHCTVRLQIYSKILSQMVELNVEISDENEFAPTFPVRIAAVNISEEAQVGDEFGIDHCLATDGDSSFNSTITYSLDKNNYFSLKQFKDETGSTRLQIKLLEKLDYELKSFHRLTLTASDSGTPSFSSKMTLQIGVIDENDNPPKFKKQEYFLSLQENINSGQAILQIQAHDSDSGLSGVINYFITGPNQDETSSLFQINQKTGEIILKQDLDREAVDEITVFIEARDLGKPQLVGRTRLVIYVSDVNDNSPIITVSFIYHSKDNTVFLPESMKKHGYFAYVNAKDYDLEFNGQVHVRLKALAAPDKEGIKTDATDMFRLTKDGFLGLTKQLDRETQSQYIICINATDKGARPRWSVKEIHVVVLDENDNAPIFSQQFYNVTIAESADVGTPVIQIQASDLDATNSSSLVQTEDGSILASTNGDIDYSLDARSAGTFSIERRTGVITLVSPLDREKVSKWVIIVTAKDNGYPLAKRSTCRLLVTVSDTNDNAPVFINPSENDASVYATILRDDVITRIEAEDNDEGDNGHVRYLLLSVDKVSQINHVNSSLFLIDFATGDLRLNMSHQNLTNSLGHHVVLIQARDFGFPPMRVERRLNVIVTDDLVLPSNRSNNKHKNGDGNSTILLIVIIAAVLTGILLLSLIIALVRRKKNCEQNQCKTPASPDMGKMLSTSTKQQQYSANFSRNASMDNLASQKFSDKEIESTTYDTSSTDVTHLSRNDVLVRCSLRQEHSPSKVTSSREGSLQRRQVSAGNNVLSRRDGHDADSGRGDSDPGLGSPFEQGLIRRSSFGPNCSDQCIQYGHSDHCWMPKKSWRSSSPSNVFENKFHSSKILLNKRHSADCQEYVSKTQTQLTPVYYPSDSGKMTLTSLYSKTLPHVLVTPATWTENLNLEVDSGSSVDCKRTASSDVSTNLTYITESEVV